jgi:hypothetical protein
MSCPDVLPKPTLKGIDAFLKWNLCVSLIARLEALQTSSVHHVRTFLSDNLAQ